MFCTLLVDKYSRRANINWEIETSIRIYISQDIYILLSKLNMGLNVLEIIRFFTLFLYLIKSPNLSISIPQILNIKYRNGDKK